MSTFECKCHWCGKKLIRKTQGKTVTLHFCDRVCKGEHQRTAKPVTREWLFEHYITKGLDTTQIGHMVKRDPKSVWNWLKDFGIPTRPRGQNGAANGWHPSKGTPNPFLGKKHSAETLAKMRARKVSVSARKKIADKCRERGSVPYLKNGQHWLKTVPKEKHPKWKGGITPERQAFYQTPEWKRAERNVKKRDKRTCRRCGKVKKKGEPFDIHHVVGFACVELRAVESNLIYLCEPCHYWVHGAENMDRKFIKEM